MIARVTLFVLMCLSLLTACNLSNNSPTAEPLITPTPTTDFQTEKPLVSVLSPVAGDEFVVGEEILVSANATDSVGVTRMQLWVNNQIVKTVSSEQLNGDTTMSAILDYTPRAAGTITMRVLAYRGAVVSDPTDIQVTIRGSQAQVTATPIGNVNVPQIPNDGVCRALTNTGLNFRQGPSTDFDVITVLSTGTLAPIIGRLGNNTWWKLNVGGQEGWVSADFTTEYGNCLNVPLAQPPVTATPPTPPTSTPTNTPQITNTPVPSNTPVPRPPDLIVTDFSGAEDLVIASGDSDVTSSYSITISNLGLGDSGEFLTIVDFDGNEEIEVARISDLADGSSFILSVDLTFDTAGEFILEVKADSDNEVSESSEVNNSAILRVTVTAE